MVGTFVHRRFAWRSRSAVVVSLLLLTLGVTSAITWEATRASRAQRATAEAVLQDYAAFAAWEYARTTKQQLDAGLERTLSSLKCSDSARHLPAMSHAATGAACDCGGTPDHVRSFFHVDGPTGNWRVVGEPLSPQLREIVAARMPRPQDGRHLHPGTTLQVVEVDSRVAVLAWRYEHNARGEATVAHGLVADGALLTPLLKAAATSSPLLPPALIDRGGAGDVLALSVRDGRGRSLYQSASPRSEYVADAQLDERLAALTVSAALAPEAANRLIIGGLPQSRLPWLYGLIAIAIALVAFAGVQIRRQIELVRMRGEFVSGVSHELRTPLAQIRMFAETLALGRVRSAEESRRSIEIILQESQRLSHLVDNVLSFSRADRKPLALTFERVPLNHVLSEIVESCEPLARSRRATLALDLPAQLEATVDTNAVRQIVINLVDNALKYGPAGQTVSVGARRDGDRVRLWVEDQGPGIVESDRARIWEPFWRASGSAQGGSGIGLAIVRQLANAHAGQALVRDAANGGARFEVHWPDTTDRQTAIGLSTALRESA